MIVMKKIRSGYKAEDLKTLRLDEEGWRDIEEGRSRTRSVETFFKDLKDW